MSWQLYTFFGDWCAHWLLWIKSLPDQTIHIGLGYMEFDKVADEVVRIPVIDFTDVTLVLNDTYGDTVRGGDGGDGHGG